MGYVKSNTQELNPGHWHEATDRAHCVSEIIQTMLLDHPAIAQTHDIRIFIEEAQNKIGEAYHLLGNRMFEENEKNG
jgi:hypothetical protein